jgi:hypothetical protein
MNTIPSEYDASELRRMRVLDMPPDPAQDRIIALTAKPLSAPMVPGHWWTNAASGSRRAATPLYAGTPLRRKNRLKVSWNQLTIFYQPRADLRSGAFSGAAALALESPNSRAGIGCRIYFAHRKTRLDRYSDRLGEPQRADRWNGLADHGDGCKYPSVGTKNMNCGEQAA